MWNMEAKPLGRYTNLKHLIFPKSSTPWGIFLNISEIKTFDFFQTSPLPNSSLANNVAYDIGETFIF